MIRNLLLWILGGVFIIPVFLVFWFSAGHYGELLFDCFPFYPMFWNGIFYAAVITLLQFLVMLPCAFGFRFSHFRGKRWLFFFYVVLMMMPLQVTILPNYIGLRELSILNTRAGIILPMVFSPFGVVVMHQYMQRISNSSIEAARLETSSVLRILLSVVVPQMKPCIFAVGLFVFAEAYNMLEQPMLFLKDDKLKNLAVFISQSDLYSGEVLFPAAVFYILPVFLLYLFCNESLEEGMTFGDL